MIWKRIVKIGRGQNRALFLRLFVVFNTAFQAADDSQSKLLSGQSDPIDISHRTRLSF